MYCGIMMQNKARVCIEVECECEVDIFIGAIIDPLCPTKTTEMGVKLGRWHIFGSPVRAKWWQIEQNSVMTGSHEWAFDRHKLSA